MASSRSVSRIQDFTCFKATKGFIDAQIVAMRIKLYFGFEEMFFTVKIFVECSNI